MVLRVQGVQQAKEPDMNTTCRLWPGILTVLLLSSHGLLAQTEGLQIGQVRRGVVYIKSFIPKDGCGHQPG